LRKPKFDGKTSYNSEYRGWKFDASQPDETTQLRTGDIFVPERPAFKGVSNYDENFTEYDLP
jgi:hypothetical protein